MFGGADVLDSGEFVSAGLFLLCLLLRSIIANRHVRGRLLASMYAFGADALIQFGVLYVRMPATLSGPLLLISPLLVSFGAINGLVALALNSWRADRIPDRFPTIAQDTIVIVLFAIASTLILQERIFAATAAGAIALGFGLQETLGNLFAGLAIRLEKPFEVGHWVRLGENDGQVSEITWRAAKIRTITGNFMIVPNSTIARDNIINYSEPSKDMRVEFDVGVSYDAPPNLVKQTILAAIRDEPMITKTIAPEVLIANFGDSSIVYRTRVWTSDFAAVDGRLADHMRSAVYYAFRRTGLTIPYPIQVEISREDVPPPAPDPQIAEDAIDQVSIFSALSDADRAELAHLARFDVYAAGEAIVRQHERGSSMFVLVRGRATVTIDPGDREVATIEAGGFFGEMSLLTGEPRTATVKAAVDSETLEITADAFKKVVLAHPAAVEQVGEAVAQRRAELARHAAAGGAGVKVEAPQRFLDRVRRFLGVAR